jgi:Ca-activated chloride channel family protein
MNEDKILKAVKAATSVQVSSRTDDAVLKAAREKAAEMKAAGGSAAKAPRKPRFLRIAAIAATVVLVCGAALVAGQMGVFDPVARWLGFYGESPQSVTAPAEHQAEKQRGWESMSPSGGEIGGDVPTNDEPYPMMFFRSYNENPSLDLREYRSSNFAADVDTGSYTIMRRYLSDGNIPPEKAVRTEEFLNYFDYGYAPPAKGALAVYLNGAPSKFASVENSYLLRIGVKAKEISAEARKPANLVILVDTSSSMAIGDRIGLVRKSLRMLVDALRPDDAVAVVAFGADAQTVLQRTPLRDRDAVIRAIEALVPLSGPDRTNLESGLQLAYKLAEKTFDEGKINRIVLCSDGVANAGATGPMSLLDKVVRNARKGICLSAVGFGIGNYNDFLMEQLADRADGNYAYIDTIGEAKRVFVDNLAGTLQVAARDVKIQVDFNPDVVKRYRLIGYENRQLGEKGGVGGGDGGEIGAGQSMTALYEIRFRDNAAKGPVAFVSAEYTDAETGKAARIVKKFAREDFGASFEKAPAGFRLAAAVAEFAEILRKSRYAEECTFADVLPVIQDILKERPDDAAVTELQSLITN